MTNFTQQQIEESYNRVTTNPRVTGNASLKAQIAVRTTDKQEYNTKYGVTHMVYSNQQEMKKRKIEAWHNTYSKLICMQAATMGSAESEIVELKHLIKTTKYYKQRVKMCVNRLDEQFLEKWVKGFSRRDFVSGIFEDIMDESQESLRGDVIKLYYCIKSEMDKQGNPDSAIKAKVYTTYKLVELACTCHDAHIGVGPYLDMGISRADESRLREAIAKVERGEDCKTEGYDHEYACILRNARPTTIKALMLEVLQGVCGTWTHTTNGQVQSCLDVIKNKITSAKWLDKVTMAGLLNNDMYAEEIAVLENLELVKCGVIDITIDILEGVRMYLQGKDNDYIEGVCRECYAGDPTADKRVERVLAVVDMLRLCQNNEGGFDIMNKLTKEMHENGREAAQRMVDDMKKEQAPAEAPQSEQDALAEMLAQKFGKVTKQKEKKPQPKPVKKPAPAEPLKLEIQPALRKRLANRWSQEEEEYLCSEVEKGIPYETIGKMLHRTAPACYQRYLKIQKRPQNNEPQLGI